jgi:hypothetical protein
MTSLTWTTRPADESSNPEDYRFALIHDPVVYIEPDDDDDRDDDDPDDPREGARPFRHLTAAPITSRIA